MTCEPNAFAPDWAAAFAHAVSASALKSVRMCINGTPVEEQWRCDRCGRTNATPLTPIEFCHVPSPNVDFDPGSRTCMSCVYADMSQRYRTVSCDK